MSVEYKDGKTPGSTQPEGVFAISFSMEKHPSVQSYPEEVLISKYSETEDRACFRLVSIQTDDSTVGLADLLLAMGDQSLLPDGSED